MVRALPEREHSEVRPDFAARTQWGWLLELAGEYGGVAYSSASRQISTETSSTLSGIGGSGLVAFTHTPSSA